MPEVIDEAYDQRHHRRVPVSLQARVNFAGRWHSCEIVDLSGGGAMLRAQITPAVDSTILVQLRGVGIIRAHVMKKDGRNFAVAFNRQDYDVDAMVDNLMLQANAKILGSKSEQSDDPADQASVAKIEPLEKTDITPKRFLKENAGRRLRSIIGC